MAWNFPGLRDLRWSLRLCATQLPSNTVFYFRVHLLGIGGGLNLCDPPRSRSSRMTRVVNWIQFHLGNIGLLIPW